MEDHSSQTRMKMDSSPGQTKSNPPSQPESTSAPAWHGKVPSREKPDYIAGLLSFVIPGLGQFTQGRVFKGLLFFVCLHFLFFYGWVLGKQSNVYLPRAEQCVPFKTNWVRLFNTIPFPKPVYYRWQYGGQFFMGITAWPAVIQCYWADEESEPDKHPPLLGKYLKAPPERELNKLQTEGDASWELAWVFTVAAGLLNLLVIYDALCGPAVIPGNRTQNKDKAP